MLLSHLLHTCILQLYPSACIMSICLWWRRPSREISESISFRLKVWWAPLFPSPARVYIAALPLRSSHNHRRFRRVNIASYLLLSPLTCGSSITLNMASVIRRALVLGKSRRKYEEDMTSKGPHRYWRWTEVRSCHLRPAERGLISFVTSRVFCCDKICQR